MHRSALALTALFVAPSLAWSLPSPRGTGYRVEAGRVHPDAPASEILRDGGSHWRPLPFPRLPKDLDRFWLSVAVETFDPRPTALYLSGLFSSTVYWDGEAIGHNGRVGGSAVAEIPGQIDRVFVLPPRRTEPGIHRILIHAARTQSPWRPSWQGYGFALGDAEALTRSLQTHAYLPLMSLSALGLVGLFALALGLQPNAPSGLRPFGVLCLAVGTLLLAESWRGLFNYPYPYHLWRLRTVLFVSVGVAAWLPYSIARLLAVRPGRWYGVLGATIAIALTVIPGFDGRTLCVLGSSVLFTSAIVVRGWQLGRTNASRFMVPAVISTGVLLWDPLAFLEIGFFLTFALWVGAVLIDVSETFRRTRRAEASAQLRSARLELELLRRHMRPHFLMNVLNAVSDWVETDPPTAVHFIEALGREFRALVRVADRPLVPLTEELALCRSFLVVMSYREDRRFELTIEGSTDGIEIPPGVLHTLVENAVTHGGRDRRATEIRCRVDRAPTAWWIEVDTPLAERSAPSITERKGASRPGTGHRFVAASLHHAFGDSASFEARQFGQRWVCKIQCEVT